MSNENEWVDLNTPYPRYWYEERERMMIVNYYPNISDEDFKPHCHLSAFVNMLRRPTEDEIIRCMQRCLDAVGVKGKPVNLRRIHPNYRSESDQFWGADIEASE